MDNTNITNELTPLIQKLDKAAKVLSTQESGPAVIEMRAQCVLYAAFLTDLVNVRIELNADTKDMLPIVDEFAALILTFK